jgi:aryl-alcohol dehydrogenase-like predicted oxidoreductase
VAQVSTAVRATLANSAYIVGSAGHIRVPEPYSNDRRDPQPSHFFVKNGDGEQRINVPTQFTSFGYEVQVASRAILDGQTETREMSWDDTLGQMQTLDAWRQEIGLTYPQETPQGFPAPLSGRPAKVDPEAAMTYGQIPGLDRPVSRFIMGCDNQPNFPHAAVMFDDWIERGGNTFDTAHLYGGGKQERLLGQWIASRGVRDQVNIIGKGCHTPANRPEKVATELNESLERLQTDHVEVYILHRDNPDIPAGEFVDAINEQVKAGRVRVFGGSHWSIDRFREANDYAEAHGRQPMSLLSNNFSLARMIEPVWGGCIASSTDEARQFHIDHHVPNLAWSSQARGFFVSKSATGQIGRHAANSWNDEANRQRRERAFELAKRYGVSAINIAAAYVLNQPFPSFALIGPRKLDETRTSMPALGVELSEQELAYLDLRD